MWRNNSWNKASNIYNSISRYWSNNNNRDNKLNGTGAIEGIANGIIAKADGPAAPAVDSSATNADVRY